MDTKIHPLIIIGSGPAGLTAAVYAARANLHPVIIEGNNPGGQLMNTTHVENWPGEISILGPSLMSNMQKHAEHFGTQFISENIARVDFSARPFSLYTDSNTVLKTHAVIVATGATPKKLNVPGESDYWGGKGVTTCAVCDGAFYPNKKVVIIGGGDTAMEDASFLKKFTNDITIIHILDKLTASYAMQQRVLNDPSITIMYNSMVTSFSGDGDHVKSVTITNKVTQEVTTMAIDAAFVAIGLNPNTSAFKGQLEMDAIGYITVTDQVKTSVQGVFAAGDVHDFRYRQAITSAGAGCMAALQAQHYLSSINE